MFSVCHINPEKPVDHKNWLLCHACAQVGCSIPRGKSLTSHEPPSVTTGGFIPFHFTNFSEESRLGFLGADPEKPMSSHWLQGDGYSPRQ